MAVAPFNMSSICCASKSLRISNSYFFQVWWSKYSSAAANSTENIKIPDRIPRGTTDILKALQKTVSYDFTGPSYRYFDDPHLAPYYDRQGRVLSLSKSAGRKAARWFLNEHPELFTQVVSDPPVLSYMPSTPINADTASEEMLFQKICETKVSDAIKVYNILKDKKIDVPKETQLALLELLCYHNCEDPTAMEDTAERYYGQSGTKQDMSLNNWRNHPLVDSLFSSLQEMGSAPYTALICGLYNYGAKAEGDKLVEEAKGKKIKLDVYAYNAMITRTISMYDKIDVKRAWIMDILEEMNSQGVKPNLGTLNSAMNAFSRMGFPDKYGFLVQLMAEFKRIGVEPSIGTFGYFLRGLMGREKPDPNLQVFVGSILKSLAGQDLSMRHTSDVLFFDWLMKACAVLENLPCAIQGMELFLHSNNRMLLDGFKSSIFFNNFFQVLSKKADFDTLIKYYTLLVPHTHTASPAFYELLFEACDLNGAIKDYPIYWKHYLASGAMSEETLFRMVEVAVNLTSLPDPEAVKAQPVLGELAEKFVNYKIESEQQRVFDKVPLSNELCQSLLILMARGYRWSAIQNCLKFMEEKRMTPGEDSLTQILENCYEHANPNMAVWAIKFYHSAFGSIVNVKSLASTYISSDFLSDTLKKELEEVIDSSSSSSSSESDSSDSDSDSSDCDDISIPKETNQKH